MKKVFLLVISLLITNALTGCSSSNSTSASKKSNSSGGSSNTSGTTITVDFITQAPPQKLLAQFTKQTGIKVNWVNIGWDALQTKIAAAASANTYLADVTDVDWSKIGEYYKTKWFKPLNPYFNTSSLKSDVPQLSSFTSHGQLLGIPVDASIMLTTVNTEDFKKAGITTMPTTFSQYNADLKKIQSSGVNQSPLGIPFSAAEGLSTYWYETTAAMGGQILNSKNQSMFTSPQSPGYKAMEWMVNAYKSGLVPKGNIDMIDSKEMQTEMAANRVSTIFSDYSGNLGTIYNVPNQSSVVNQVSYIPTPGINGTHTNLGNPDGMGILANAKYPKAAAEFIKWFTSKQTQIDISGGNGPSLAIKQWPFPMRLSAMKQLTQKNDKVTQASTMYKLFKNNAKSTFQNGAPSWYSKFSNAVYTNIHSAAQGQETVSQAINQIASTVKSLNNQ